MANAKRDDLRRKEARPQPLLRRLGRILVGQNLAHVGRDTFTRRADGKRLAQANFGGNAIILNKSLARLGYVVVSRQSRCARPGQSRDEEGGDRDGAAPTPLRR